MISPVIRAFYLPVFKKHRKIFLLLAIQGIIAGGISVLLPLLAKIETDQLVEKNTFNLFGTEISPFLFFVYILCGILIVNIIEKLSSSLIDIITKAHKDYIMNDTQLQIFQHMEGMEVGRTINSRFKHISRIIKREFEALSDQIISTPSEIIRDCISLLGIVAVYTYFDIRLLGVVVVSAIIGHVIYIYSDKIRLRHQIKWQFTLGQKQYFYENLFTFNFINLATNGAVHSTLVQYENLLDAEIKSGLQKDWSILTWDVVDLLNSTLTNVIIKCIVGYSVFIGTQSVGMVVLVITSANTVNTLVSRILKLQIGIKKYRFRESSIELFLKLCKPIGTIEKRKSSSHDLTIENLSFTYPNLAEYELEYLDIAQKSLPAYTGQQWLYESIQELIVQIKSDKNIEPPIILSNISMSFKPGNIYGIVGKNGSGKTTLMHLIAGFFRTHTGKILIGGEDTRQWKSDMYAKYISFLTQVPFTLGHGSTLRESILLGVKKSVEDPEIWKYLEMFHLSTKIKKNTKGLDSLIGDDIEFSGGEIQIIAFIRLLLQDRPIVILDEGTNQLDAENELLVMRELFKHKLEKIIIFITHRMSTISRADWIYCIEKGSLSAEGSHTQLLEERNNAYARFYRAQIHHEDESSNNLNEET